MQAYTAEFNARNRIPGTVYTEIAISCVRFVVYVEIEQLPETGLSQAWRMSVDVRSAQNNRAREHTCALASEASCGNQIMTATPSSAHPSRSVM